MQRMINQHLQALWADHKDKGYGNDASFVLALSRMVRKVAKEAHERCAKLVDLGCLGPPCCELGKSHARHCPQTLSDKIRKAGDL